MNTGLLSGSSRNTGQSRGVLLDRPRPGPRTGISRMREPAPSVIDVRMRPYNASPRGIGDAGRGIQRAYNDLPRSGGKLILPSDRERIGPVKGALGTYAIYRTLQVGDGTTSAVSKRGGVTIEGEGYTNLFQMHNTPVGRAQDGTVKLLWKSSSAGIMMQQNGPMEGAFLRHLCFDGNGVASELLKQVSVHFGGLTNVSFKGFTLYGLHQTIVPIFGTPGTNVDFLSFEDIYFSVPDIQFCAAIYLEGNDSETNASCCYQRYDGVYIMAFNISVNFVTAGFVFRNVDSVTVDNFRLVKTTTGGGLVAPVVFDYRGSRTEWPQDIVMNEVDFNGTNPSNVGTPSGGNLTPNRIMNLARCNGVTSNPSLSNLNWGYSSTTYP